MNKIIFALSIFLSFNSWSQKEYITIDGESYEAIAAPNMVRISANFYADQTEVTNLFYKEYLHWVKTVFGASSQEYIDAQPDAGVWMNHKDIETDHDKYFWGSEFYDYPLVGVTLDQAMKYAKWRTDRVVEMRLVHNGIVNFNINQNKDNYFTIEKFSNGSYPLRNELKSNLVYHRFSVPTIEEWKVLADLNDKNGNDAMQFTDKDFNSIPTFSTKNGPKNRFGLYHVFGNVAELVAKNGVAMGGNWKYSTIKMDQKRETRQNIPNCWTGFRNVSTLNVLKKSEN